MELGKTIKAFEAKRAEAAEQQKALMALATEEGRTLDEKEASEYDELKNKIKACDAHLERLYEQEQADAATAAEIQPETKYADKASRGPTVFVRSQDPEDEFEGQSFTRAVIAKVLSQKLHVPASVIAEHRWGKTHKNLVGKIKTGEVSAGSVSDAANLGNWVGPRYAGDFINYLYARTIYDQLDLRHVPANIPIKGQGAQGVAYWTGEGKAIAPTSVTATTVTLSRLKLAAIAVITNELISQASLPAEQFVRDALVEAVTQKLDTTFLSNAAGTAGVTPAGLINGVTEVTTGTGTDNSTFDNVILLANKMVDEFIAAHNASGDLVWIMNPGDAQTLATMRTSLGVTLFPGLTSRGGEFLGYKVVTGHNVIQNRLYLVKPDEVYAIDDRGVEVTMSMEATLEMNNAPTGDAVTPAGQTVDPVNMFQSDSTALKIVRPVNFAKRRSAGVVSVNSYFLTTQA